MNSIALGFLLALALCASADAAKAPGARIAAKRALHLARRARLAATDRLRASRRRLADAPRIPSIGAVLKAEATAVRDEIEDLRETERELRRHMSVRTGETAAKPEMKAMECSVCKSASDCQGYSQALVCHQMKCVLADAGRPSAESTKRCFPHLAECALCTEEKECGSGVCMFHRCVDGSDTESSLYRCGIEPAEVGSAGKAGKFGGSSGGSFGRASALSGGDDLFGDDDWEDF